MFANFVSMCLWSYNYKRAFTNKHKSLIQLARGCTFCGLAKNEDRLL